MSDDLVDTLRGILAPQDLSHLFDGEDPLVGLLEEIRGVSRPADVVEPCGAPGPRGCGNCEHCLEWADEAYAAERERGW